MNTGLSAEYRIKSRENIGSKLSRAKTACTAATALSGTAEPSFKKPVSASGETLPENEGIVTCSPEGLPELAGAVGVAGASTAPFAPSCCRATATRVPHSGQNTATSGTSVPQLVQNIGNLLRICVGESPPTSLTNDSMVEKRNSPL